MYLSNGGEPSPDGEDSPSYFVLRRNLIINSVNKDLYTIKKYLYFSVLDKATYLQYNIATKLHYNVVLSYSTRS